MKQAPNVEQGLAEVENAAVIGNADGDARGRKVLAAAGITDRKVAAQLRARAAAEEAEQSTEEAAAEPATRPGDSKVTGRASRTERMSTTEQATPGERT